MADWEDAAPWQGNARADEEMGSVRSIPTSAHLRAVAASRSRVPDRPQRNARDERNARSAPQPPPKRCSSDEAKLARMVATGDPGAASALWKKYSRLVRGLLRRELGETADVEDLVQDAFVGLLRTLPGLREPDALRSFVVGTALRVARSELRRRRVRRCVSYAAGGRVPDSPHLGGSDPEARRALRRLDEVLGEVDERGRFAFVLRHLEGYELTEVAGSLDCSLATAKRVLARVEQRVTAMAKGDSLLASYASFAPVPTPTARPRRRPRDLD
jgi:RNA polymerase sigma-70 factor (ECF subfamily)